MYIKHYLIKKELAMKVKSNHNQLAAAVQQCKIFRVQKVPNKKLFDKKKERQKSKILDKTEREKS